MLAGLSPVDQGPGGQRDMWPCLCFGVVGREARRVCIVLRTVDTVDRYGAMASSPFSDSCTHISS